MTAAALLSALEAHRLRVTARLDALPDAVVHASPGPGAWSLAQLGEHLCKIDAGLEVVGLEASRAVRTTSRARSAVLQGVLSLPVRIPAPPSADGVMPSASPQWPEVRERWAVLRSRWSVLEGAPSGRVAYRHPIFGPFVLEDALAFLLAHHRHHDAQIRRTILAVGPVTVPRLEPPAGAAAVLEDARRA